MSHHRHILRCFARGNVNPTQSPGSSLRDAEGTCRKALAILLQRFFGRAVQAARPGGAVNFFRAIEFPSAATLESTMRLLLMSILMLAPSLAVAEVWVVRHGSCAEYRSQWNVEQDASGIWVGSVEQEHIGGPCAPATGKVYDSEVRAVIVGDNLFAARRSDAVVCSYYGRIQERRLRGFELCEGSGERLVFALRFPAAAGPRDSRQRDEWMDDPRTYDREQVPRGFNLEVAPGQRR
jgi:hypothetical protein